MYEYSDHVLVFRVWKILFSDLASSYPCTFLTNGLDTSGAICFSRLSQQQSEKLLILAFGPAHHPISYMLVPPHSEMSFLSWRYLPENDFLKTIMAKWSFSYYYEKAAHQFVT